MTNEIEPVLDAATGAVIGRTVDGFHSSHSDPSDDSGHALCLNCQTPLQGDYCHACGQAAHSHRTLHGFVHDLLHGAFHFEGRIWHTLPMLAFRPGTLTRRYIDGQRIRFISPVALFLFLVFLTFAVFSLGGDHAPEGKSHPVSVVSGSKPEQGDPRADLKTELSEMKTGNTTIDAKIA
ncbi:MAG: DUF3667 domain-containing protein, partial [Asticcacaulis sp.]